MRTPAIVAGVKAFVQQAKQNYLEHCKAVVAKAENSKPSKKESK